MAWRRIAALGHGSFFGTSDVMESTRRQSRVGLVLFIASFAGLPINSPVAPFASTDDALVALGRRLSRSKSDVELSALASHGDALVRLLEPAERSALARGYLHFRVNSPVVVWVAVPVSSVPFWIHDLGFEPDEMVLANEDTSWKLFKKTFAPGSIGLGVNGLDRTPPAHYAVFVRNADRRAADSPESLIVLDPESAPLEGQPRQPGSQRGS